MPQAPRAQLLAYSVAVVATAVSLLVRWPLWPVLGNAVPHMTFFPAIMLAAYFGGLWPGLLATMLSTLAANYFLTEQLRYFSITSVNDLAAMILFVLVGTVISGLSEHRKRAGVALQEQANLLDLTHDSIFVRDMNDVIAYWNRGATELYGWTREEAVGKISHQLTQTVFPMRLEEMNAELLRTDRWEGELIHTKRDGTQIVVASRWALQRDESDRPVAVLETNNDITGRKHAEEALRDTQAELAHVTRVMTMGELAASIAHEVNQPLAAVVTNGNASLRWLAGEPPNLAEAQECLRRIIRDGNRASAVIARIRSLVKKSAPAQARLDLNEAIQEVLAVTNTEARRRRVAVRTELAAGLPMVRGDRVQLQQVILNLVMNGIEAMETVTDRPRELLIRSRPHESDAALVAVQDSGIGLDPQSMERLFEAFYTTKPEGMGMGLSISRSIIEAHGGRLWPAANGDHGATFHFTLPIDNRNQHE